MRIISGVVPGASRLTSISGLSKKARQRLEWFDYYNSHGGKPASLAATLGSAQRNYILTPPRCGNRYLYHGLVADKNPKVHCLEEEPPPAIIHALQVQSRSFTKAFYAFLIYYCVSEFFYF